MSPSGRLKCSFVIIVAVIAVWSRGAYTQSDGQPVNDLPNSYQTIRNWGSLPDGRTWGSLSAVDIGPDGKSVWAAERCGGNTCAGSNLPAGEGVAVDVAGNIYGAEVTVRGLTKYVKQ